MMKNLHVVNARVAGLVGNRIRCTQLVYWLLPFVDDNILLTVIVVLDTILILESGRMLLSPQHIIQI